MIELVEKGEECFRQEAVMGLGSLWAIQETGVWSAETRGRGCVRM
jgi:hypothetical protein